MEEKLKKLSEEGIEKLLNWAQTTEDFVAEQTPLLIQEILTYSGIERLIYCLICLIVIGITYFLIHGCITKTDNENSHFYCNTSDEKEAIGILFAISLAVTIITFVVFIANLLVLVKITFAPRMYIIEYLSNLM